MCGGVADFAGCGGVAEPDHLLVSGGLGWQYLNEHSHGVSFFGMLQPEQSVVVSQAEQQCKTHCIHTLLKGTRDMQELFGLL